MDRIAQKVAALVLAQEHFIVKDPLAELRGETLDASKLATYEGLLKETTEAYVKKRKELEASKTPGRSNPRAGGVGRELQVLRRKGTKARARVEIAKWMARRKYKTFTFNDKATGGPDQMEVLHKDLLKGETIWGSKLKQYESAAKAAKAAYDKKKAENKDLSGGARGRGGHELSKLGKEMRLADARVYAARELAKHGLIDKAVI